MHLKVQFLFFKSRCQEGGEERWTESEGEERRRMKGPLRVEADSLGLQGGGSTAALCLVVFGVVSLFFLGLEKLLRHTHIQTQPTHMHAGSGDASRGRCREMGWERHPFARRWLIQPVINYNLASQRQGLGEFLCWSGLQLIVFFLLVQAKVGAEQRPNRGTGCLHVWRWPSLLELLHNVKSLMWKDWILQPGTEQHNFNTYSG